MKLNFLLILAIVFILNFSMVLTKGPGSSVLAKFIQNIIRDGKYEGDQ